MKVIRGGDGYWRFPHVTEYESTALVDVDIPAGTGQVAFGNGEFPVPVWTNFEETIRHLNAQLLAVSAESVNLRIIAQDAEAKSATLLMERDEARSMVEGLQAQVAELTARVEALTPVIPAMTPAQVIRQKMREDLAALTADYTKEEVDTFGLQLTEAVARVTGATPYTSYLTTLAAERISDGSESGTVEEVTHVLCLRVLGKADAISVASATIIARADAAVAALGNNA